MENLIRWMHRESCKYPRNVFHFFTTVVDLWAIEGHIAYACNIRLHTFLLHLDLFSQLSYTTSAVLIHLVFHLGKASSVQRMRRRKFVRAQGCAPCGSDMRFPETPRERAGERYDQERGSCDKDGRRSADSGGCPSWGSVLHRRILQLSAIPAHCAHKKTQARHPHYPTYLEQGKANFVVSTKT
jgi:hypothetical protein